MMSKLQPGTWWADPAHFARPSRRDLLRVGFCGALGLSLGEMLRLEAQAATTGRKIEPKAQAVIHIYLQGGFAQTDSWDPKPDAPAEYRGILTPIKTRLPGVYFSNHMEKTAEVADKLTIVRSITHTEVDHARGEHNMMTGYRPSPALVYPSIASVVSHELGPQKDMPPYIALPNVGSQYMGSGYLSNAHGPFALGADPARPGFSVRDLSLPRGVSEDRFARRREWRSLVSDHFAQMEKEDALDTLDSFYQRAYGMLSNKRVQEAFSLKSEPEKIKTLYGISSSGGAAYRTTGGARFIMARRLIEAGARFVSVTFGSWDTHAFHYNGIEYQMPALDRALAGLLIDLDQRGLLDSTLVIVNSEFGRTPKINAGGGRDHWPRVFSILLAGGGIKRGQVYGASDGLAAEPTRDALSVEDYAHTLYHLLGIDASKDLMSPGNRPQPIVLNGKVVKGLLA